MYKILTFILLFAYVQSRTLPRAPIATKAECSNFQPAERFDCHPEDNANQQNCEARGCCWVTKKETVIDTKLPAPGVPTCYYPRNYGGYEWINITEVDNGIVAYLQRTFQSAYPRDVQTVRIDVEYQTNDRVRVKISDAVNKRWESIYPKNSSRYIKAADNPNYDVVIDNQHLGFIVRRKDGTELFNSQDLGAFIFADQFLQISARFNGDIFGIGEQRTTFNLNKDWTRYTIFNGGQPPSNGINLYGAHPFYMVVEPDGRSHGVFLLNSNAMDVLIQPLDAITYKTIGGILDFYFFMGPTPADVVKQYLDIIGKPIFPPYWGMGFQLCKYGYGSADNTRAVWRRNLDAGIPFDVQWNDIDCLDKQNDFTYDHDNFAGLPQLINDIHEAGMHWVPIVDAGVSSGEPLGTHPPYDDGVAMDTFLKDQDGNIYLAKVWNYVSTAFPDFTHPNSTAYWTKQLKEYHDQVPFDAIWIDMNEPSNFNNGFPDGCPDSELETPPYLPNVVGGQLCFQTVCMTAKHYAGDHYNIHNLHAAGEAEATQTALVEILGKRSFVISRASSFGAGLYTGHWSGDIFSTWDDLAMSISNMFQYNIFGMPFSGADICGFNFDTNPALCNRWFQVGAFYPFSRNHNGLGQLDQDPASFEQDVIDSIKKALTVRYTLLPYLYTLLYRSHVYGETVFRPLFFEFLDDRNTLKIESSFLWGAGIYVVPVLEENAVTVTGYFPKARWYDWYTGEELRGNAENVELDAPFDKVPVFIRGGYIIPTQAPSQTTTQSRKNGFTFIVALDDNNSATGNLFWDDGESLDSVSGNKHGLLEFTASDNKFTSSVQRWETDDTPQLESIKLLAVNTEVNEVIVNGQSAEITREPNNVINVVGLSIPLNTDVEVEWR